MHNSLTPPVAIAVIETMRVNAAQARLAPRRRRSSRWLHLSGRGAALRHAVPRGRIHTPAAS